MPDNTVPEMTCKRCGKEAPPGSSFCPYCGKALSRTQSPKKRGNGQGSVFRTSTGKYKAVVTLGYFTGEDGKRHRQTRSQTFSTKKDAVNALPDLAKNPAKEARKDLTFKEVYDAWLPTHKAGKSTIYCYQAAMAYLKPVWAMKLCDLEIDDFQDCIDSCPKGKRTKATMKIVVGLVYKYAIPRKYCENLNPAQFLSVSGDPAIHRVGFTVEEIEAIKKACGKVPHAEDILCMIYTGFRPMEFLSLTSSSYDAARQCLIGGSKTQAGKDRAVTISPKILPFITQAVASGGFLFSHPSGRQWRLQEYTNKVFYPALEAIGIDNPLVEAGGGTQRHRLTPHSCRHTFATLMKRVPGALKDKQALIGHASIEMLLYYEDAPLEDKRKITDLI